MLINVLCLSSLWGMSAKAAETIDGGTWWINFNDDRTVSISQDDGTEISLKEGTLIAPGTVLKENYNTYTTGNVLLYKDGPNKDATDYHFGVEYSKTLPTPSAGMKTDYYTVGSTFVGNGDYTYVELFATPDENGGTKPVLNTGKTPTHVHSMEWMLLQAPTATTDGVESYRCVECGYAPLGNQTIAAYPYFVKDSLQKIQKAPLNGTVKISSPIFGSVPVSVLQAIAARPDLTVEFNLIHNHENYKIVIPTGAAIDTSCEYYGVLKLSELYDLQ